MIARPRFATLRPCHSPRLRIVRVVIASVFLLSVIGHSESRAVSLSPNHKGEALILPVFSTAGGLSTLVTVMNVDTMHGRPPVAVKVTFRDRAGSRLLSVNAYVTGGGSWVSSLSPSSGGTQLELPGPLCTLAQGEAGVIPVTSVEFEAQVGYIEILELGRLTGFTGSEAAQDGECLELADVWNSGGWSEDGNTDIGPPFDELRASASIIDVERGTMYSFVAAALAEFSDIPQHTSPGSELPDLTSAHDAGTDSEATTSRNCEGGVCLEETWARPKDAVSAALLAYEVEAEFVIEEEIRAGTEFVFTYPMRPYYDAEEAFSTFDIALLTTDRIGQAYPIPDPCNPPIPGEFPCERSWEVPQDQALEVIDFSQPRANEGTVAPSGILGIQEEVVVFKELLPEAGAAKAGFRNLGSEFVSNEGTSYRGVPAVSVALQEYVNGTLRDDGGNRIRANYGNAFPVTRTSRQD